MIEMKDVIKRYGKLVALDHFNLTVQEGQIHGLLGPNGSGKSTAINSLLALLAIDRGEIRVFGEVITPTSYKLKRDIGLVPQDVAVFDELTVEENIDYYCGLYVTDHRQRKKLVDEAIAFTDLDKFRRFVPKKLSGGLKRRLNIACGIAHKPKLLILDEPTVAVDPQSRNSILEGIRRLNQEGVTVLYTTHYMEEVEALCDMITIMDKGKQIMRGTKEELKASINLGDQVSMRLMDPTADKIAAVSALPFVATADSEGDLMRLTLKQGEGRLAMLINALEAQDILVGDLSLRQPSLNDVFLEITGKELRDDG